MNLTQPEPEGTASRGLREALTILTVKAKTIGPQKKRKDGRKTQEEVVLLQRQMEEVLFFLRQKAA